jgi:hypothetical protein
MTDDQIDALPISDDAKDTLKNFTDLHGQDAVDAYNSYVSDNGKLPTIDNTDADALDQAERQATLDQLSANYNTATGSDFSDLPSGAQTALLDVAYQYGPNLSTATPDLWNDVVADDWNAVVDELKDFHDKYGSRREAEASLVQSEIDQGSFDSGDDDSSGNDDTNKRDAQPPDHGGIGQTR